MDRLCPQCGSDFEITDEDLAFLEKLSPVFNEKKESIPPPQLCPICRMQRRFSYRNESKLYKRKCDATQKMIVSLYAPDSPFKVYNDKTWWSDDWDALSYGREFDFSRSFFDQYRDLQLAVPRRALSQFGENENSDYVAYGGNMKNCYYSCSLQRCEDVLYGTAVIVSKDCVDCLFTIQCELCYECVDAKTSTRCSYCKDIANCHESSFLDNCQSCTNCICCKNLRNKEYHIYNKPVTKEEFHAFKEKMATKGWHTEAKKFEEWKLTLPYPAVHHVQAEDSTGDYLDKTKNCHNCFDTQLGAENCRHCQYSGWNARDMMDCSVSGGGSDLLYECFGTTNSFGNAFNIHIEGSGIYYCDCMHICGDCFGCIALKHKKFCILNKQYTEEEYKDLMPKIIDHMRQNKEYGEFFPTTLSPFPYNDSMAYDYFPLSKEEVEQRGWIWQKDFDDAQADVPTEAIRCSVTGKPFRLVEAELGFYKKMGLSLPTEHPVVRQRRRKQQRNPYRLWDRHCAHCNKDIQTSYSPDRPEIVYCESCYLEAVY